MSKSKPMRKMMAMEVPKSDDSICPLCCEEMDMTDLSFMPCPCGYRVCLFCVQQIKLHCRNQCPGCRREYGTVPFETAPSASASSACTSEPQLLASLGHHRDRDNEASSAPSSYHHHHNHHHHHAPSHHHHHSSSDRHTHSSSHYRGGPGAAVHARAPPPPPSRPPPAAPAHSASMHERLKRAAEHSSAARKEEAASGGGGGLPSGATWATQAITRQQQAQQQAQQQQHLHQQELERQQSQQAATPVVADESAWPSLADTVQPPPSAQQQKEAKDAAKREAQAQQAQQQHLRALLQREQQRQAREREAQQQQQQQAQQQQQQQQAQQQQQEQQLRGLSHTHSTSMDARNSMERIASSSSIEHMSQDPVVPPEQLGLQQGRIPQPPFAQHSPALAAAAAAAGDAQPSHSAQLSTSAHGQRRSVNVSLPASAGVEPYPEATPLLASLSSGVKSGGVGSKDAAAQLVALLKHKEAQQGRMQSLLAAGRAPPGFAIPQHQPAAPGAPTTTHPTPPPGLGTPTSLPTSSTPPLSSAAPGAPTSNGSCLTPLDSPVVPTPSIGRYQPIGSKPIGPSSAPSPSTIQPPASSAPPLQPPLANGNPAAAALQPPATYANGPTGTYSMWTGLPGVSIPTPTYSPLGSSLWAGLSSATLTPPGMDAHHAGLNSSAFAQPPPQAHTTAAATPFGKPPPPGFGGPAYSAGGYRPLGALPGEAAARYNPLNPLNFGGAYRPQLL